MANINPDTGQVIVPPTPTTVAPLVNPAPPTAATVYSAPNITQAVTAPVAAPNLSDPYGLLNTFMSTPEILAAQQAVAQGQTDINSVNQGLRNTKTSLENQNTFALGGTGATMNMLGRQLGRASDLASNKLAGLGEMQQANIANLSTLKETANQKYAIAQQERGQLQDLITKTGGNAGISFGDSYEDALKKADTYNKAEEVKAKAETEKERLRIQKETDKRNKEVLEKAEKQGLKDTAQSLGLKTSGSSKQLRDRIAKAIKEEKNAEKAAKAQERLDKLDAANKSGGGDSDKAFAATEKALNADIDSWKAKMKAETANWADAYSSIKRTYGLSADVIDNLLGLDYRNKYDK